MEQTLRHVTNNLADLIMESALRGTLLIGIALVAILLLRNRSSAHRAAVWQFAIAGLACLPILTCLLPPARLLAPPPERAASNGSDISHAPVRNNASEFTETRLKQREPEASTPPDANPNKSEKRTTVPEVASLRKTPPSEISQPATSEKASLAPPHVSSFIGSNWRQVVCLIWAAGAIGFLTRLLLDCLALRRLLNRSRLASPAEAESLNEILTEMGYVRPVALSISPVKAPAVCGLLNPRILLPESFFLSSPSRRNAALRHEIAHIRRRDWGFRMLSEVVRSLYWFTPFVPLATMRLRHETELACDDCVIASGCDRADYAAQIVEMIQTMKTNPLSGLPLSSLAMAQPPVAQSRIEAILHRSLNRAPLGRRAAASLCLLSCLLIPALALRVSANGRTAPLKLLEIRKSTGVSAESSSPLSYDIALPESFDRRGASEFAPARSETPAMKKVMSLSPMNHETAFFEGVQWGGVKDGLQAGIRIRGSKTAFKPGQKIEFDCYLRNTTDREISCLYSMDAYGDERPTVTDNRWGEGQPEIEGISFLARPSSEIVTFKAHEAINLPHSGLVLGQALDREGQPVGAVREAFPRIKHPVAGDYQLAQSVTYQVLSSKDANAQIEKIRTSKITGQINVSEYLSPSGKRRKGTSAIQGRADSRDSLTTGRVDFSIKGDPLKTAGLEDVGWGPVEKGLRAGVRIKGGKSEFTSGQRIPLECFLQNRSDREIAFYASIRGYREETPRVRISSKNGVYDESLVDIREVEGVYLTGIQVCYFIVLKPGESLVLWSPGLALGKTEEPTGDKNVTGLEKWPFLKSAAAGDYRLAQPISYQIVGSEEARRNIESARKRDGVMGTEPITILSANGKPRRLKSTFVGQPNEMGTLLSGEVDFSIADRKQSAAVDPDKSGITWGEAWKGVRAGLKFKSGRTQFKSGDTIELEYVVKNFGQTSVSYKARRDLYEGIEIASGDGKKTFQIAFPTLADVKPGSKIAIGDTIKFESIPDAVIALKPGEVKRYPIHVPLSLIRQEKGSALPPLLYPGSYLISVRGDRVKLLSGLPNDFEFRLGAGPLTFEILEDRPISWGDSKGDVQIGARMKTTQTTFKFGETIFFEPFVRNLTEGVLQATVANFWKINYEIEIETAGGKPVYKTRSSENKPELVAGYRLEAFGTKGYQQVSTGILQPYAPNRKPKPIANSEEDNYVESVEMKPGDYRARIVNRNSFGVQNQNPTSGWVKFKLE